MLTINTNLSSLIVQSNLKTSTNGLNGAIERMTTGFKLNHAKDNAANYSISTSLTTKLGAYTIAEENAMMGLDMVQTASSSLSQMSDLASRLRSLATQAQNGTYGSTSLDALNSEANAIVKELFRIQNTTQYNGINLLNGGTSTNIATNAIATLSTASTTSTQSSPRATSSGFIEAVQRRDTSAMTTLASVDENTNLDSGTYSISTAEELAKLATMTNNGKVNGNAEFVLANDIDLSAYREDGGWTPIGNTSNSFYGTFDGNGYKIKNLYINRPDENYQGLFGRFLYRGSKKTQILKNIGLENVNLVGNSDIGGLAGGAASSSITNCYVMGNVSGSDYIGGLVGGGGSLITNCYTSGNVTGLGNEIGGLVGRSRSVTISNCYTTTDVKGYSFVGGVIGSGDPSIITNCYASGNVTGLGNEIGGLVGYCGIANYGKQAVISNCFATGNVTGQGYGIGGLVGDSASSTISNCYATGSVSGASSVGGLLGLGKSSLLNNSYFVDKSGTLDGIGDGKTATSTVAAVTQKELKDLIAQGILPSYLAPDLDMGLQIGINGTDNNQLDFSISQLDIFSLDGLSMSNTNALETIDDFLKSINEQQTSLGAIENRLMSAIESIGVNINNLTSTRSTIKDADVAELSSEYIRNQILQQASATLLATANQNPSIALQLI